MDVMTLAAKLTLNTSEFEAGLNSSEKEMKGLTSGGVAWGNLISNVVQKAGKAMLNFGKQTVQVGMDFDTQMSQVKALGQLQDDEFIQIRQRAMKLGESTKFTAAQVAEAFSYMALAGWDTEEMLDGIDGVLNLAAASGEDLGRTSDIVTDALTAFGLEAKDSGHFVDVLAAASANSNTTVSQMGEAFKYLATTGGVLGYSIDDVAIGLGLLANNGIKSSQAGTSLRRIITSLISPTDKAAEAMSALGVNLFEEGTDKVKPFKQVMSELRTIFKESDFNLEGVDIAEIQPQIDELDAWYDEMSQKIEEGGGKITDSVDGSILKQKDIDEEYASQLQAITGFNELFLGRLSDIGGVRGISSLIALMKTTDKDFDQLVSSVENSEGSAQEMAETMLDNLEGDITILKSALEGLQIVVSDSFKAKLRSFVQTFTEEIGKLNSAFQENGFLGVFVELADWIINGVIDSLTEPTDQQVADFGTAIGEFIGKVIAKLITSLPDLLKSIVTLGEGLAGGLIEGLLKGLFGDNSQVATLVDNLNKELSGIEVNSVKAQGLLDYLQELIDSGDENVKNTEAWKVAVEQLEGVMPGVKDILEDEGSTLQENLDKVRNMTDEFRKQAIQQAMVNTLQKQYELLAEQGVERERYKIDYDMAAKQQQAVINTYQDQIQKYAQFISDKISTGEYEDEYGAMTEMVDNLLQGKIWAGDSYADIKDLDNEQLSSILSQLTSSVFDYDDSIWNKDQNYLSPQELQSLSGQYNEAGEGMKTATSKIDEINNQMDATKSEIATTEAAVKSVTEELGTTASGVGVAGGNVTAALNTVANEISGISFGGGEDGSHAKGLWSVPYDDYTANLHRGEMVLTASQARDYRSGSGSMDFSSMESSIIAAIRSGMEGATVHSYLNGKDITDEVNRNNTNSVKAMRYRT